MSNIRTITSVELLYGSDDVASSLLHDPAENYHEASKLYRSRVRRQSDAYFIESSVNALLSTIRSGKRWLHLPSLPLPVPAFPETTIGNTLAGRRSRNEFSSKSISLAQLGTLLFATYGVTHRVRGKVQGEEVEQVFRTTPSGGALYPLDIYAAVHRVDGLESGIYFYDSLAHAIVEMRASSPTRELSEACIYPKAVLTAAVTLILVAVFWRSRFKYRLRAYRNTLLEAGHAAQNALLAATSLGLGSVPFVGFFDAEVDAMLRLDGVNQSTLYCVSVGTYDAA